VGSASAATLSIVRTPATGNWNQSKSTGIQKQIKKKKLKAFVKKFPESVVGLTPVQVQQLYRTAQQRKRTGK
jgi:hypothetical protein